MDSKLSEFHTGYRAFSRELLESLPFEAMIRIDFLFSPITAQERIISVP
jgi:hypothetical protein